MFIKSDKNIIEGNGNIQGSTLTINNNAESLTDTIKKHRIKITDDMFNSIKLGMSYEDVCNIMQMKGVVMYEIENGNYISYKWGDDVFISLIADFKNNKLVRKVKT